MDSTNQLLSSAGYDWGGQSISDSHQYAGPQTAADSTVDGFPLQEPFHPNDGNSPEIPPALGNGDHSLPPTERLVLEDELEDHGEEDSPSSDIPASRHPRHSRNKNADLDIHKEEIRRLWLVEDKSLKHVMATMKEKYSLLESEKRYKEKFAAWEWRKNLPNGHAQWMAQKAHKRKRDDDKETIFLWKGNQWDRVDAEKRAARARKSGTGAEATVETPSEIDYETPQNNPTSPQNTMSPPKTFGKGKRKQAQQTYSDEENDEHELSLSWRGHSKEQLVSMLEMARNYAQTDFKKAEDLFSIVLEGYSHLLGSTNEDTVKVAFAMASLYTEHGRRSDADEKIEDVCRWHISKFGMDDKRTQQVILQIVEMLNAWNRQSDALAFLARSKDIASAEADCGSASKSKAKRRRRGKVSQAQKSAPGNELPAIAQDIISSKSPAQVDYGISVARTHAAANDAGVEAFLQAIIFHCQEDPVTLEIQNLKARSELMKFYNKASRSLEQRAMFLSSINAASVALLRSTWDKKSFKSFELLEAVLELTAAVLKGGIEDEAWRLFNQIGHKADDDFGYDEERTIWAKINIGMIYENIKGWEYAKSWFTYAYAAAFAANGGSDGITMALETALEKRHFSYLSDEGRPFKTIFGVCGLTIRPARLHID